MTYKILLPLDGNFAKTAKHIIENIGQRFSKDFVFESYSPSQDLATVVKQAKSANAVLFDEGIDNTLLRALSKELGLHTQVRKIANKLVVNDAFCGIYSHEKGFRNNSAFGREAFDTECFSELEIERVARTAYELAPSRHITLIDKADELATSKLWRKIVTDINEDYPFVNVEMAYINNVFSLLKNEDIADTLLMTNLFGDIIFGYLKTQSDGIEYSALLGDTTLAMYSSNDTPTSVNFTISFMLRQSFDMQEEADFLDK